MPLLNKYALLKYLCKYNGYSPCQSIHVSKVSLTELKSCKDCFQRPLFRDGISGTVFTFSSQKRKTNVHAFAYLKICTCRRNNGSEDIKYYAIKDRGHYKVWNTQAELHICPSWLPGKRFQNEKNENNCQSCIWQRTFPRVHKTILKCKKSKQLCQNGERVINE